MNVFWFACSSVAIVCPAGVSGGARARSARYRERSRGGGAYGRAAKGGVVSLRDKALGRELMAAATRGSCSSWSFPTRPWASGLR